MDLQLGSIQFFPRSPEAVAVSAEAECHRLRAQVAELEARNRALKVIISQHRDLARRLESEPAGYQIPEATADEVAALSDCIGDLDADALLLSLLSRIAPAVAQAKFNFLKGDK